MDTKNIGHISDLSLNVCSDIIYDESSCVDKASRASSSTDTSSSSCFEEEDEVIQDNTDACTKFMQAHVSHLFDSNYNISSSDKQLFGNYCQTSHGREVFAKYVDRHRNQSLQVDECTFYKLAHSFALVLFECAEADDYIPSKTLMNMAFTYYHYPEGSSWNYKQKSSETVELDSPDMSEYTTNLSESDGENDEFQNVKETANIKSKTNNIKGETNSQKNSLLKVANNWLNKESATYRQFFKDFLTLTKQVGNNGNELNKTHKSGFASNSVAESNDLKEKKDAKISFPTLNNGKHEKVYLYQALQHQTIWQSLRFWNAAFFDAVNSERQQHFSRLQWNSLSAAERESASETIRNVTFGQLGTFINNMKHLGIGKDTCLQFLRKQSLIGDLNKDLYKLLRCQIDTPL